jgi:hypothetical protein
MPILNIRGDDSRDMTITLVGYAHKPYSYEKYEGQLVVHGSESDVQIELRRRRTSSGLYYAAALDLFGEELCDHLYGLIRRNLSERGGYQLEVPDRHWKHICDALEQEDLLHR